MRTVIISIISVLLFHTAIAQHKGYTDSIKIYQQKYIDSHEVVKAADKQYLHFYNIGKAYCVTGQFEYIANGEWFNMPTTTGRSQVFRKYGKVTFRIHDTTVHLFVYQSQSLMNMPKYKDYLFIPFTDLTTGAGSYDNGRYIDVTTGDIHQDRLIVDFNKAYNPYCAYIAGFSCPLPPAENALPVTIAAGEMKFSKPH